MGTSSHKKKHDMNYDMPSKFLISYSCEGGYTASYEDSLRKTITINQDGEVRNLGLVFDFSDEFDKYTYKVDKTKAIELMKFFYENKFYELPEDLSDIRWCDASTVYLEVRSNTFNHKVGGYAASTNDKLQKFIELFHDTIDSEKIK